MIFICTCKNIKIQTFCVPSSFPAKTHLHRVSWYQLSSLYTFHCWHRKGSPAAHRCCLKIGIYSICLAKLQYFEPLFRILLLSIFFMDFPCFRHWRVSDYCSQNFYLFLRAQAKIQNSYEVIALSLLDLLLFPLFTF